MHAAAHPLRFDRLDALRGAAIVWMVAYHLAFDLNHFGLLQPRQDFYRDPTWTLQRTAIVSLFLAVAGGSVAVALDAGQPWRRFGRRWLQVAGCALLVSFGSWWMFPRSWISFGVLHGMAVMLPLARALAPARGGLVPLALVALLLPAFVAAPWFDTRATNWLGLTTHKPLTEDWVPVLPWLGVVLLGLAAGQALLARARPRAWLAAAVPRPLALLAVLGRWPLTVYMLHQPLLLGALALLAGSR